MSKLREDAIAAILLSIATLVIAAAVLVPPILWLEGAICHATWRAAVRNKFLPEHVKAHRQAKMARSE